MTTITEFLTARWDAAETIARAALESDEDWVIQVGPRGRQILGMSGNRVLRDIAAKRAIMEWCSERDKVWIGGIGDDPTDPLNYIDGEYSHAHDSVVLRFLAQPYAEHPDFDPDWRVG